MLIIRCLQAPLDYLYEFNICPYSSCFFHADSCRQPAPGGPLLGLQLLVIYSAHETVNTVISQLGLTTGLCGQFPVRLSERLGG